MKKFKFLFLAALVAVMSIGCAQPTNDDTPIIPAVETSEPEAQPSDIYEAALAMENSDDGNILLYRKFIFQNDQYELQLSGPSNENNYLGTISDDNKLHIMLPPVCNKQFNLQLLSEYIIVYWDLAQNWHEIVDKCYKKL